LTELEFGKRYFARDRRTARTYAQDLGIRPLVVGNRRFYRIVDILRAEEKMTSQTRIRS
jgi:predicted type IV restriction endonuclease